MLTDEVSVELSANSQAESQVDWSISHYKILSSIGTGGMGEVYLAEDTRLPRRVAIKFLRADVTDPSARRRLIREAEAAANLDHPNICSIIEVGEEDGRSFIVMQYVDGETLARRIKSEPLELMQLLGFAVQIADALAEAHTHGIIHRDIKPQNLMITGRGQVKVLDFGLAKHMPQESSLDSQAQTESLLTDPQVIVGTVPYMSPEQVRGARIDARSDLFSFGASLYEMATGRQPFAADSTAATISAVLTFEPPPITRFSPDAPAELGRIIAKALAKDREKRYQSAQDLLVDLQSVKAALEAEAIIERSLGDTATARSSSSTAAKTKPSPTKLGFLRRSIWTSGAMGIVLVAGLVGVLLALVFSIFWQGGLVPTAEAKSVVALPCKVYGAQDVAYLTDAIPSTLSTLLGNVEGLEVKVPPTSFESATFKDDPYRIAELYRSQAVVITSVNAESSTLLLDFKLVESSSRRLLWAKQYSAHRDQYNAIVLQAADDIREALKPTSDALKSSGSIASNSEAELLFQRGKFSSNRYNNLHEQADFDTAFSSFKSALERDPSLADAAAEIAFLFVFRSETGDPGVEVSSIESWANRALEINPRCGRGYVALAAADEYSQSGSPRKRLLYTFKAAFFSPRDPFVHLGLSHFLASSLAIESARESARLDPLYLYAPLNAANLLYTEGHSAEALALLDQAVLSIEPEHTLGLVKKSLCLIDLGRVQEATALLTKVEGLVSAGRMPESSALEVRYAIAVENRQSEKARALLGRVLTIIHDPQGSLGPIVEFNVDLSPILLRRGDVESMIQILLGSLERGVIPQYDWLMLNPRCEPLRRDDRVKTIFLRSRQEFDEMLAILKGARSRAELPYYLEAPLADLIKKLGTGR